MKIGISLNEVMRDFIGQLAFTREKYKKEEEEGELVKFDLKGLPVGNFEELHRYFRFITVEELNHFLYVEASLEIFGMSDLVEDNLMTNFNRFLIDIEDEEEHEVEIVSLEINKSIPATLFFLSKTGCLANKIRLVKKYRQKWDGLDVLITANPLALAQKPDGKISIKIKTPYNINSESDYELDSIIEFINDESLRDKILKTKTTTYYDII